MPLIITNSPKIASLCGVQVEGEQLTTLDEEERDRELTADMLVIADAEKPVALAGVMGGYDSEITETTCDVLLESAYFNPSSIRATARALGNEHGSLLQI